jgi:TPR repeat protein
MYTYGQGVKQDDFKAKELFGKACDGGDAIGCKSYAILNK